MSRASKSEPTRSDGGIVSSRRILPEYVLVAPSSSVVLTHEHMGVIALS